MIGDWVVALKPLDLGVVPGEVGEIIANVTDELAIIDWDLHGEIVCKKDEYKTMESFDDRDQS